jgi:2-iminobutanoate/2-iminopropanoate deaminase
LFFSRHYKNPHTPFFAKIGLLVDGKFCNFKLFIKSVKMSKTIIHTGKAPAPIGPYSQAVKAGGFLFLSGQVALVPGTSELETGNIREETIRVMENLKAVLEEEGLNFSHVVKTTIFLKEMSSFAEVNEEYGKYFERDFPARETVAVKTLPRDVNVEISMIAHAG